MGIRTEVRRGRPKKSEERGELKFTGVKLTGEEWLMLETLRRNSGATRSDILREALYEQYKTYKKTQNVDPLDYEYFDEMDEDFD